LTPAAIAARRAKPPSYGLGKVGDDGNPQSAIRNPKSANTPIRRPAARHRDTLQENPA